MLFVGKKSPEKTVLILDVESGSVGSALVRLVPKKQPKLFGETRAYAPLSMSRSGSALYTNIKADKLLENIRKTSDRELQKTYLDNFNKEIKNDIPAVFTYSPYFIYIVPKKVHNVKIGSPETPSERFSDIRSWYIETNNVWGFFAKK